MPSPRPSSIRQRSNRSLSSSVSAVRSPSWASIALGGSIRRPSAAAIGRKTRLITVMHSNNEVGTLQPIREIAAAGPRTRRAGPHRCGPVVGQGAGRCQGTRRRSPDRGGPQAVRAEGGGCPVCSPRNDAGAVDPRGGSRRRPAGGHGECALPGGPRNGVRHRSRSLPAATGKLRGLRDRLWDGLRAGWANAWSSMGIRNCGCPIR